MYSKHIKDKKKRLNYIEKILCKNVCILNHKIQKNLRGTFFNKFKFKNKSKSNIVRRCIFTNRNRGSIRKFGLSRIKLKELLNIGSIPGYTRSVW